MAKIGNLSDPSFDVIHVSDTRRDIICSPHYILKSCETRSVGRADIRGLCWRRDVSRARDHWSRYEKSSATIWS